MKLGSIRKENYGPIAAAVNVVAGAVVYFFGADNGNTLAVALSISLTALAFCLLGTGLAIAALVANKKSDIFAWIALFIGLHRICDKSVQDTNNDLIFRSGSVEL